MLFWPLILFSWWGGKRLAAPPLVYAPECGHIIQVGLNKFVTKTTQLIFKTTHNFINKKVYFPFFN